MLGFRFVRAIRSISTSSPRLSVFVADSIPVDENERLVRQIGVRILTKVGLARVGVYVRSHYRRQYWITLDCLKSEID